jgi:hypothetical protein
MRARRDPHPTVVEGVDPVGVATVRPLPFSELQSWGRGRPAAGGTVKRVVLTSSCAAIVAVTTRRSAPKRTGPVWTPSPPYQKSKTLAERAAWDFVATLPAAQLFELVAVNPGMVLGPLGWTSCAACWPGTCRQCPGCRSRSWTSGTWPSGTGWRWRCRRRRATGTSWPARRSARGHRRVVGDRRGDSPLPRARRC